MTFWFPTITYKIDETVSEKKSMYMSCSPPAMLRDEYILHVFCFGKTAFLTNAKKLMTFSAKSPHGRKNKG